MNLDHKNKLLREFPKILRLKSVIPKLKKLNGLNLNHSIYNLRAKFQSSNIQCQFYKPKSQSKEFEFLT